LPASSDLAASTKSSRRDVMENPSVFARPSVGE
jgi:hypothetical protein